MAVVRIVEGAFGEKDAEFVRASHVLYVPVGNLGEIEKINFAHDVARLEKCGDDMVRKHAASVRWNPADLAIERGGLLGAIPFVGKSRAAKVCISCELKDGRKFIALTDSISLAAMEESVGAHAVA